jgi:hypothetical protein
MLLKPKNIKPKIKHQTSKLNIIFINTTVQPFLKEYTVLILVERQAKGDR